MMQDVSAIPYVAAFFPFPAMRLKEIHPRGPGKIGIWQM